jgi:hypothetical protein
MPRVKRELAFESEEEEFQDTREEEEPAELDEEEQNAEDTFERHRSGEGAGPSGTAVTTRWAGTGI